ncbi:ABC transporter permease [Caldilinea sp.]|uniref:ABC transporter permease n=1 Tax=Caldilinea sp. TaxID=2293560 RepID=UPI0021DCF60C|nr:ABC transporter permease [Caldilinea sp.]GIV69208.1 MAG: dolichyl-phosphate beta-glucosyltransferase [Caldilinea sp.]
MQTESSLSRTQLRQDANRWLRTYGTFIGFLAMIVIFSLLRPGVFLSPNNLRNITEQVAILAIVATTMTVVMVVGDFDLSVGALASLSGVVVADLLIQGVGLWPAVLVALAVGAAAGLLNGLLVAYFGLSAFVATLATMTAFRGLSLFYTNGSTLFSGIPESFRLFGQSFTGPIPNSVLIMLGVLAATWFVLEQTTFGRRLYAVGGNAQASYLAGLNVRALRLSAFVISGLGAALAGVVLTSRLFSAHPTAGEPLMLNSIAAVFLGMTMFREGEPHVPGTFVGVLLLGVMSNGLNILQVNSYIQLVLTGAIILLAVLLSGLARRE